MTENRPSRFHLPIARSTFAGLVGAGVFDALLVLLRGHQAHAFEALALGLGLYGTAGLLCAALLGWAAATVLGAIPGGWQALREDESLDARVCGLLFGGVVSGLVLAAGAGLGYAGFVSTMNSRTLATIASAGLALLFVLPAALALLSTWQWAARVARRFLPRPARLGRTGLFAIVLGGAGLLAFVAALSRADWRVLDLGPMGAAGIALALGIAHGLFWYDSATGKRFLQRLPRRILRPAIAVTVVILLVLGSRIPESSPTYAAIGEGALGLKFALKLARKATDRDGDGYSALFGGGDCDDHRADVYPGAEDIPGDGIDQNCEGGDAPLVAESASENDATVAAGATTTKPSLAKAGKFSGNILIIAVDATRADRLGVAGYGRPAGRSLTPNLDELARRGAYFRRVWAQAPNTPRSFPAFVTSRYPSEIAWQKRSLNYSPLLPSNQTIFEPMATAGWHPIGIFSHFYFTADRGISKSFAEWSDDGAKTIADSNKDIAAPRIVPRVIERLKKAAKTGERFVLWTHLFEPHSSYMSHAEFPTTLSGVQGLEEKYDYEIAFDDLWIGKILKTLEETRLADNTAIVVFGDHGEAWGEHKIYFHGQDLSEEQLRVPLIVAVPGRAPVVSDDEVGLIDVGPTLLDLIGVTPPKHLHGRSLLPIIEGEKLPARPIFAELLPSTATPDHQVVVVDRGLKLLHKVSERRFELFDLRADPKQTKNLAEDPAHKGLLDELKAKLAAFEEHRPLGK
ncbi:MAG TPA: sulfatase-like hydrolase/transferase [Polyangia bacterium]